MPFLGWLNDVLYDGAPYCLAVLSFLITLRYLNFPDLTPAGSFVFGAAVATIAVVHFQANPYLALLLAVGAGAIAGGTTAFLSSVLKIEKLLAGILCAFLLYGVNQLLLSPTLPYGNSPTILSSAEFQDRQIDIGNIAWHPWSIAVFVVLVITAKVVLDFYLGSEEGLLLRALEDSDAGEDVQRRNGASPDAYRARGLVISNSLVAVAGAVTSMREGAANAHRGFDVLVTGMVAYLIGAQLAKIAKRRDKEARKDRFAMARRLLRFQPTTAAVLGTLVYFGLIDLSQRIQIRPELTRVMLVILVVAAMGDFSRIRRTLTYRRTESEPSSTADSYALVLRDVRYRYPDADEDAVRNVSLAIKPGELVALAGVNGTGKSTILKIAAGMYDPADGHIFLDGKEVTGDGAARLKSIVYVDQNPHRGVVDTLTVEENLAFNGDRPSLWRRALSKKRSLVSAQALEIGDLPFTHLYREASTLSGGQRQVTNLLGLLTRTTLPRLVMLDEPTNNLDAEHSARCREIINALRQRGTAVVLVSHAEMGDLRVDRTITLPSHVIGQDTPPTGQSGLTISGPKRV